jgi:hypothetical protein
MQTINRLDLHHDDLLFRTVTALGAELRRQSADGLPAPNVDLIDLAYAALAASSRNPSPRYISSAHLERSYSKVRRNYDPD